MLDIFVAYRLFSAIKKGTRVLLVGDPDQLPSVGPGNILKDVLNHVPSIKLNKIFRQAAESSIIVNAHRINNGQMPIFDKTRKDLIFMEREDPEEVISCVKACLKGFPYDLMDIQILAPMRKGPVGTNEINKAIQEMFSGKELRHNSFVFKEGDKVIHTKNDYNKGVLNGDVGVVKEISDNRLSVRYNGNVITYNYNDLNELEPAWCVTVHKSQGSEYKAVIIIVSASHYVMLVRNLLYTALTGAKETVIVVGTRRAIGMAVRNNKPTERYTMLGKYFC